TTHFGSTKVQDHRHHFVNRPAGGIQHHCIRSGFQRGVGSIFIHLIPSLDLLVEPVRVGIITASDHLQVAASHPFLDGSGEKHLDIGVGHDVGADIPAVHHHSTASGHLPLLFHQHATDLHHPGHL